MASALFIAGFTEKAHATIRKDTTTINNKDAQVLLNKTSKANDSLTDADTVYHYVHILGSFATVNFQVDVLKLSGTLAGSTTLKTSADFGANYITYATDTLTDASQYRRYLVTGGNTDGWYRFDDITSGTNSSTHKVYIAVRR